MLPLHCTNTVWILAGTVLIRARFVSVHVESVQFGSLQIQILLGSKMGLVWNVNVALVSTGDLLYCIIRSSYF